MGHNEKKDILSARCFFLIDVAARRCSRLIVDSVVRCSVLVVVLAAGECLCVHVKVVSVDCNQREYVLLILMDVCIYKCK